MTGTRKDRKWVPVFLEAARQVGYRARFKENNYLLIWHEGNPPCF